MLLDNIDNSNITGNTIDMVNSDAKDIGILVDADSDDNTISSNVIINYGTAISEL